MKRVGKSAARSLREAILFYGGVHGTMVMLSCVRIISSSQCTQMSFYPSTFSEQQGQNDIWMYPDDDSKCSPTGREGGKVANTRGRRMRQRERRERERQRQRRRWRNQFFFRPIQNHSNKVPLAK